MLRDLNMIWEFVTVQSSIAVMTLPIPIRCNVHLLIVGKLVDYPMKMLLECAIQFGYASIS